jgi:hypothetical protein
MATRYREKLLKEIQQVPEESIPNLYRIFHILKVELVRKTKTGKRGSLREIWGKKRVDESLFRDAKRTLFPYDAK